MVLFHLLSKKKKIKLRKFGIVYGTPVFDKVDLVGTLND